jgi:hypothetical protein
MKLMFATCLAYQHVLHNLATGDVSNVQMPRPNAMVYSSRTHAVGNSSDRRRVETMNRTGFVGNVLDERPCVEPCVPTFR